ncbi:MAG: NACHT domain-containing protein, partial [Nitrospinaceae bacterium]
MSESNPTPLVKRETAAPQVRTRPEEDPEWVIATYSKHRLREVSQELDGDLGPGREPSQYIHRVLLDMNPVHHRQSLQEQIFPNPRAVQEDLLEVGKNKLLLEAAAGMGKTIFLKVYQETRLAAPPAPAYPLTVYLDLGLLPPGTGFAEFYPMFFRHAAAMVLREKEEQPGLEIREDVLQRTLKRLVAGGQVMFLLDGLDRLAAADRLQFFHDVVIDGDVLQDNFVVIAMRPVGFGPAAAASLVKRGRDACFRLNFQKLEDKVWKKYLGEHAHKGILDNLRLHHPDLFDTPLLLRLLKTVAQSGQLGKVTGRTRLYDVWLDLVIPWEGKEGAAPRRAALLGRLETLAFQLAAAGRLQRHLVDATDYEMELLAGEPALSNGNIVLWVLDPILRQTSRRWEFRHPSFQEYFAGRCLAGDPDWETHLSAHCRDGHWQELLSYFIGAFAGSLDPVYDRLVGRGALFLAGGALIEAGALSESWRLLVGQLLKYQDREAFPQFSKNRLIQPAAVIDRMAPDTLRAVL